ncbi:MAG: membrane protein [Planctomycetota bacterium]|nr:MAG: membrane protein [Planctomycetota bacterium]
MKLSRPEMLFVLFALLPLVGLVIWAGMRAARRRTRLLGGMASSLLPQFSVGKRSVRDALALLAFASLTVGLAGPLVGKEMREVERRGVDVMVVLDTSRSMLARDLQPSRLERAKREVRGLLELLAGDRMGIVTFAGDARRVTPLTHDANTLRLFLDDIDTTTNSLGGTAVGEGLELALETFDEKGTAEAVIVLLTDGEDHTSDPAPTEIAFKARARGVPVHVVAFGTREGGQIPVLDGRQVLRDAEGQVVISRPDHRLLEQIAGTSQGAFLSAETTAFPLDEIFAKRIATMPGVARAQRLREQGVDRFQWAVLLALGCLALRAGLRDGLREGSST